MCELMTGLYVWFVSASYRSRLNTEEKINTYFCQALIASQIVY